jgi:hypothetical protein
MTDECEREDEDLTVDEISALRWTKPAHLNLIGIDKAAAAIRLLAVRLLEEIARANEAEQKRAQEADAVRVVLRRRRDVTTMDLIPGQRLTVDMVEGAWGVET